MSAEEYNNIVAVNNSSIDYFLDTPMSFKLFIDKMVEQKEETFYNIGSAIHCLILEPDEFENRFSVVDYKEPANSQQKLFCTDIYNALINGIEPESQDFYDIINLSYQMNYSTKNKKEDKLLSEATDLYNKTKDYIMFLVEDNKKIILSTKELDLVKSCVNKVVAHEHANKLIYNHPDTSIVKYECPIVEDINGLKCKSKLDILRIDNAEKVIRVIDVKSTSKPFKDFEKAANEYNYFRQFAFYAMMVYSAIKNKHILTLEDTSDYRFEALIIATKTVGSNECKIYSINQNFVLNELEKLNTILAKIKWHFDNNQWEHEMEYYTNNGLNSIQYFG